MVSPVIHHGLIQRIQKTGICCVNMYFSYVYWDGITDNSSTYLASPSKTKCSFLGYWYDDVSYYVAKPYSPRALLAKVQE